MKEHVNQVWLGAGAAIHNLCRQCELDARKHLKKFRRKTSECCADCAQTARKKNVEEWPEELDKS